MESAMIEELPQLRSTHYVKLDQRFNAHASAQILVQALSVYPAGTVFAVESNPDGQNSTVIALLTEKGQFVVGFNNEIIDHFRAYVGIQKAWLISRESDLLSFNTKGVSMVAHFAAVLARTKSLDELKVGHEHQLDRVQTKPFEVVQIDDHAAAKATITSVTAFGDCVLSAQIDPLCKLINNGLRLKPLKSRIHVAVIHDDSPHPPKEMVFTYGRDFYDVSNEGDPVAVPWNGFLKLALRKGNLAQTAALQVGDSLCITRISEGQ